MLIFSNRTLFVDIPEPIQIPTAVNDVVNGNKGSNITVKCVSQANPPATYKWTKLVEFNGLTKEENIGEESRMGELTLYSAFINDTGKYKCSAFNFPNPNKPKEKYGAYKTITIKVNCKYLCLILITLLEVLCYTEIRF